MLKYCVKSLSALTILYAGSKTSLACFNEVAAQYTSAPGSLSAQRQYKPITLAKIDLPFFLGTSIYTSVNLLKSFFFSANRNITEYKTTAKVLT